MRFDSLKSLALAASLAVPMAATAQGVQPYNPQDAQNYGTPAQQNYGVQQAYGQQPQYADQQSQYDQQSYTPGGQEQIYQAPPALPTYEQPPAPGDGYIWTPGYWAYGPGGYYWVPGAWVLPPYEDALWTPGYWGYAPTGYFWNAGYWGPEVGFYGGINYGFGYFGIGFYGGCWRDHRFWYNREYSHINAYGRNVYSERYNGIRDPRPTGRSFTTVNVARNDFRGGSYNGAGRGFAGSQGNAGVRGYTGPGQYSTGHPVQPGSTYSQMNRGSYNAPIQRPVETMEPSRAQGFNGGYSQRVAPAQSYNGGGYSQHVAPSQNYNGGGYSQRMAPVQSYQHSAPQYSAPSQQHFSAPSAPSAPHYSAPSGGGGGGSFHGNSGGGGGGSHGGGGGRR